MQDALRPPKTDWLVGPTRALLAVAPMLGGAWLYARIKSPFPYDGTFYDRRPAATSFTATDQDGRPATFGGSGQVTALFFGFLHCPNVCPLTLTSLEQARAALPASLRDDFRVVFVTLDPARDRPEKIKSYVRDFGQDITGLYVREPKLAEVARAYGVEYTRVDGPSANTDQINHTPGTSLIDREGRLRLVWDDTQLPNVERVTRDLRQVIGE